jgi:hypothetical protein
MEARQIYKFEAWRVRARQRFMKVVDDCSALSFYYNSDMFDLGWHDNFFLKGRPAIEYKYPFLCDFKHSFEELIQRIRRMQAKAARRRILEFPKEWGKLDSRKAKRGRS